MRKLFLYSLFILISLNGFSQNVSINSFVDKNDMALNEILTFTISTNGNCQIFTPDFGGLTVLQGPFKSSSSRITEVNGKRTVEQETKFTYKLRATNTGTFTIASIKMDCAGKSYSSKSIKINVTEIGTQGQSAVPSNATSDFFLRMHANKTNVYQGEPFTVSIKMYSKNQPQNIENLEFGESKGIWRKDLNPNQTNFNTDMEVINGMRYYTTVIKTELSIAQTSGEIKIAPAYISAVFRRGFFQTYRREANSNTLKIKVKPLPKGAPKDFNGLVGKFDMTHDISKTTLKPGDAIDFKIKISGKGNMNAFDDPVLSIPNDFEKFDPEIKNNVNYSSTGIAGSIAYNYVLIPTFYGDYTLPAYSFSYFDIADKKYKTLSTGDIAINVLKTENSTAGNPGLNTSKKEIDIEKEEIRYINLAHKKAFQYNDFYIASPVYYAVLGLPFLSLWLLLVWRKKQNTSTHQQQKSHKLLIKDTQLNMDNAHRLAAENKNQEALQALNATFKNYLKQKFNLATIDLNQAKISALMQSHKMEESYIKKYNTIWNNIEMYQYAPIPTDKMDALIADANGLITYLEDKL
ncbi:hypothetical protein DNU06_10925 [Putridiphycobacter roseus]|uniref:Protein BatD n=1 Tax=Putridiphycobacter roseus TaxID=2219161 RepID=A0A2W1NBR5_9FLAO|nr:BatD family protein [Putridiphycobacter roseus]PZE16765.1 hypothetical protein DNU06_10925 [Putridiphycobacter roseus]